jgi:hypothetical protein
MDSTNNNHHSTMAPVNQDQLMSGPSHSQGAPLIRPPKRTSTSSSQFSFSYKTTLDGECPHCHFLHSHVKIDLRRSAGALHTPVCCPRCDRLWITIGKPRTGSFTTSSTSRSSTNRVEFKSTLSPLVSSATHVARSFVESPDKDDDGDRDATRPASQAMYGSEPLPNPSLSKDIKSQGVAPLLTSTINQRLHGRFQRRAKRFLQKAAVLLLAPAQSRLKKNQSTSMLPKSPVPRDSSSLPLEPSCSLRGGDDLSHLPKDQQPPQRPPVPAKSTIEKGKDKGKDNSDESASNGCGGKEMSGSDRNSQGCSRLSNGYITADPESTKKILGPFIQGPTSPQERFFADPSPFPASFPHRARSEDLMCLGDGSHLSAPGTYPCGRMSISSMGSTSTSAAGQLPPSDDPSFCQVRQGSTDAGEGSCHGHDNRGNHDVVGGLATPRPSQEQQGHENAEQNM